MIRRQTSLTVRQNTSTTVPHDNCPSLRNRSTTEVVFLSLTRRVRTARALVVGLFVAVAGVLTATTLVARPAQARLTSPVAAQAPVAAFDASQAPVVQEPPAPQTVSAADLQGAINKLG